MNKQAVDQMIDNYKEYSARCAFLEALIVQTERAVKSMKEGIVEDSVRLSALLDGMPRAQKGSSDPTGGLGAKVADGYESEYIQQAESELKQYRDELEYKRITTAFVNAWMEGLTLKERFVMEKKVIGGLSWRQLVFAFNKEFGDLYSQEGLKSIRKTAMEKIYRIAE